jgi:hypothetical protein
MARETARMSSEAYKHSDTCGLFNPNHTIPESVSDVVDDLRTMEGIEAVAGGCNGCTAPMIDHGVYYIAQHGDPDVVYFGYTDEEAAYTLIGVCEQLNVPCDWTGETSKKVAVGSSDAY